MPTRNSLTRASIFAVTMIAAASINGGQAASSEAIERARAELAETPGISLSEIEVESVREAHWADTSLGCPEKGKAYNPVVTAGHVVGLRAAGRVFSVHVGNGRAVVCDSLLASTKGPRARKEAQGLKLQQMARKDLAARLSVSPERIRLTAVTSTVWADTSLGCEKPGESHAKGPIRGFLIELEQAGKVFFYHTDMTKVVLCGDSTSGARERDGR